jgi:CrcB protein
MMALLAVALGGALGASMRYGVNQLTTQVLSLPLFWATLLVNVVGCFLMGKAFAYFSNHAAISEPLRLFVSVGFLGALTTWSTFSMETVLMIQNDEIIKAVSYTVITTFFCFLAFWLGVRT